MGPIKNVKIQVNWQNLLYPPSRDLGPQNENVSKYKFCSLGHSEIYMTSSFMYCVFHPISEVYNAKLLCAFKEIQEFNSNQRKYRLHLLYCNLLQCTTILITPSQPSLQQYHFSCRNHRGSQKFPHIWDVFPKIVRSTTLPKYKTF